MDSPRVAVRVAKPEECAAVALDEDADLTCLHAPGVQLLPGGHGAQLEPRIEPGAMSVWEGRFPMTIEHPEPFGVNWATCICSVRVLWSRVKPT